MSCKQTTGKQMTSFAFALLLSVACLFGSTISHAAVDVYEFDNASQEAQYKALIAEFRCPKCQNQNLAGSDSQIAQDLKRKTYEMVIDGQSDEQIRDYMYERYGDFISYKPPVRPSTWILWFFPPLFLLCLIAWWLWRNAKLGKQRFNNRSINNQGAADTDLSLDIQTLDAQTLDAQTHDVNHATKSGLSTAEKEQLEALLSKHTPIVAKTTNTSMSPKKNDDK